MNAKFPKICPHLFFPDSKYWIWVDGNLFLNVEEEKLTALTDRIAVGKHPERDNAYDEAKECIRLGLDDENIINDQIAGYSLYDMYIGLGACYIIVRKNTEEVKRLNDKWWAEICRYSVRDQISFPYIWDRWDIIPDEYFTRKPHKKPR
jgi:hypothetical protein